MSRKKYILDQQKKLLKVVTEKFPKYYLTGGTALAIELNHRFSEDLDFFSQEYKRSDPEKIMKYIQKKTGYTFKFLAEMNETGKVQMQSFLVALPKTGDMKIDVVQDAYPNINPIADGMHCIEDIYYRKIAIAAQPGFAKLNEIGREVSQGRQRSKDVFDLYYLSKNYQPLAEFFSEHFPEQYITKVDAWYRSMDRLELKLSLKDEINASHPDKVINHLDDQIIKKLSLGS